LLYSPLTQELKQIFEMYDKERAGRVPLKLMAARIQGKTESELSVSTPNHAQQQDFRDDVSSKFSVDPSTVEKNFDLLLGKLNRLGLWGVMSLTQAMRKYDVDNSCLITLDEFQAVLSELRLDFSPPEVQAMFRYLESAQRLGFMDYSLLVKDLTSGLTPARRDLIRNSYDRLDYSDHGTFDLKQLLSIFNPRNFHDVKNGRKRAEDITAELSKCIDLFTSIQRGNSHVNSEQFLEFFEQISPSIDTDGNFDNFLKNCFKFNELPRKNKLDLPSNLNMRDTANPPIYDKERFHPSESIKYTMFPGSDKDANRIPLVSVFEHIKEQLIKKGPKGFITFFKSLKNNDHDHDGKISIKEFIKSLHEVRIELLEKETLSVFKVFDPNNSGFLTTTQFMNEFVPELNARRKGIIEELLDKLSGPTGDVTYTNIKRIFNPRGHPDFVSNLKADYDIKDDFYNILNMFLTITVGINDAIPRDIMLQFFEIYSFAYTDDNYFENIVKGVFRMQKSLDPRKSYAPEEFDNQSTYSEQVNKNVKQPIKAPFGTDTQNVAVAPTRPKTASSTSSNMDNRDYNNPLTGYGQMDKMRDSQRDLKSQQGNRDRDQVSNVPSPEMSPSGMNFAKKTGAQNAFGADNREFSGSKQPAQQTFTSPAKGVGVGGLLSLKNEVRMRLLSQHLSTSRSTETSETM
jgi:Ca2+-binding EF-hand superfamily protein